MIYKGSQIAIAFSQNLTYSTIFKGESNRPSQSFSIQNNIRVISSKFINKFVQKCQCYYTLLDHPSDNYYINCFHTDRTALNIHAKKGLEMVVQQLFMRDICFETEFTSFSKIRHVHVLLHGM